MLCYKIPTDIPIHFEFDFNGLEFNSFKLMNQESSEVEDAHTIIFLKKMGTKAMVIQPNHRVAG